MTMRERRLATIVGAAAGAALLYFGANLVYFTPLEHAGVEAEALRKKFNKLRKVVRSENTLAETWNANAVRTFSFKASEAQDLFGQDLKRIAQRHGFENASFKPRSGKKIGTKTKIASVAYRISAEGRYDHAIELLHDLYQSPYLCQVTSLTLTSMGARVGRDIVKVEFTVETPVLPEIKRKDIRRASKAKPMRHDPDRPLSPFRVDLKPEGRLLVLAERNIFRSYVPAPTHMVLIDNQDLKTVALQIQFFWEGDAEQQLVETVAGTTKKPVSGKGDVVEISGSYADGERFGPQRIDLTQPKQAVFKVASHTVLPPDTVMLAVNNQSDQEVYLELVITTPDKRQIKPPKMVIEAKKTAEIGEWKATEVHVTSRYQSQMLGPTQKYKPAKTKHTLLIPPEVKLAAQQVEPPPGPVDPPPDGRSTVTGLWTYPGTQEMIVMTANERKVIRDGEKGAVDGGMLLAVHPLGGIVRMPSGRFYIYPLGKKFTERVLLHAKGEQGLASAIDAWTRQ